MCEAYESLSSIILKSFFITKRKARFPREPLAVCMFMQSSHQILLFSPASNAFPETVKA